MNMVKMRILENTLTKYGICDILIYGISHEGLKKAMKAYIITVLKK